jgi:hypothetical protein
LANMVYLAGLAVFALIVFGILRSASGDEYSEMTEEEFEAEAKRRSHIGPALMTVQKMIDPNHHVEYVREEKERVEADSAESGDRPSRETNQPNPPYELPK